MGKLTISEEILIRFLDYFNIFALCEQFRKIRILGPLLRQKESPFGPLFAQNWVPFGSPFYNLWVLLKLLNSVKGLNWPLSDTENIIKISRYFLNIAISRYFQMMQYIAFAIYRDTKRSSLVLHLILPRLITCIKVDYCTNKSWYPATVLSITCRTECS